MSRDKTPCTSLDRHLVNLCPSGEAHPVRSGHASSAGLAGRCMLRTRALSVSARFRRRTRGGTPEPRSAHWVSLTHVATQYPVHAFVESLGQ